MAKGRKRKQGKAKPDRDDVTAERRQHNEFVSMGMARRVKPPIVSLHEAGKLSNAEFSALAYYRDQASLADRSPVRCGIDFSVRSEGNGPGAAITSALIETGRMERDMGQLWDIARAVAVDDKSLSQWCVDKHGGRERLDGKGRLVAVVPICEKRHTQMALLELKMAAHRIVK